MLVFFGTLCIRPAAKSKISARALTREETASLVRKTVGFIGETLISSLSLVKEKLKKKELVLVMYRIFNNIYYDF